MRRRQWLFVVPLVFGLVGACGVDSGVSDPPESSGSGGAGSHAGNTGSGGRGGGSGGTGNTGGMGGNGGDGTGSGGSTPGTGGSAPGTGGNPGTGGSTGTGGASPEVVGPACGKMAKQIWAGSFDGPDWLLHWDAGARLLWGADQVEVRDDEKGKFSNKILRVKYPQGSLQKGGTEFKARISVMPRDAVCLSYWLRFDPSFDWVKGGKLPGVCGGTCSSGGAQTDGMNGWSIRYMWREGGNGQVYGYVLPANEFGTELGTGDWKFAKGEWHHIVEEVVLNTPNQEDGIVRVWYDGDSSSDAPAYQNTKMSFRTVAALRMNFLFFSTFFGGSTADFQSSRDTFVDFANFEIFEN